MAAPGERRRQVMLAATLAVLTAVALWVNRGLFVRDGAADALAEERVALGERIDRLASLPSLEVDPPSTAFRYRSNRDLFEFGFSPARRRELEQEARRRAEADAKREEARRSAQERAANQPPRTPPKPPEPKRPDFRYNYVAYLGAMDAPDDYVAVLQKTGARREPKKDDILVVRRGETIEKDFIVKRIGIDEVEIGYVDPKFEKYNKVVRLIEPKVDSGRRR